MVVLFEGSGAGDAFWTFAARGCDEPGGLSDSGQVFTVRVTITGDDSGNVMEASATVTVAHRRGRRRLGRGFVRRPGRKVHLRALQRREATK
jgi:hypothetical protein